MLTKESKIEIKKLIDKNEFSGVISIVEIMENPVNLEDVIFETTGGLSDIPNNEPHRFDLLYGIASGTKTFTALGILKLQDQKKLSIDDKIKNYIGDLFPKYSDDITIKNLLNHTSGIPDYFDEDDPSNLDDVNWSKYLKPADYFSLFPDKEMEFQPGTKFKYNNGGYILLAYIIEKITGNFHEFINDLATSFGTLATKFYRFDLLPINSAKGYIFHKDGTFNTNFYDVPVIGCGDGGIFTTVDDIHLLWEKLFDSKIITEKSLKDMLDPSVKTKNGFYGLGLWISETKEGYEYKMIGQDKGVSFISIYNPKTKISKIVISNNEYDAWKVLKYI